jgi:DEAD/DEAH box helicase domain-containing protein
MENVGSGDLNLPVQEMHTTSYWITLERPLLESLPFSVSERQSGMFGLLHALETVATLLLMCDRRDLGTAIGERPPVASVGQTFLSVPSLDPFSSSDFTPARMQDATSANTKEFFEPNLYLFDAYPGGIGFSEPLFRTHALLMQKTRELISSCACEQGCPSCVALGDLAPRAG